MGGEGDRRHYGRRGGQRTLWEKRGTEDTMGGEGDRGHYGRRGGQRILWEERGTENTMGGEGDRGVCKDKYMTSILSSRVQHHHYPLFFIKEHLLYSVKW